ncbi:MAG: hypothetical protein U5J63_05830 [Fodinibius sp.]|nr:hypothetical protein [Fodinibius sp.]
MSRFNNPKSPTFYMKFFKHTAAFAIGFFLLVGTAFAQGQMMQQQQSAADSVSDTELKKFASVMMDFQKASASIHEASTVHALQTKRWICSVFSKF